MENYLKRYATDTIDIAQLCRSTKEPVYLAKIALGDLVINDEAAGGGFAIITDAYAVLSPPWRNWSCYAACFRKISSTDTC